MNTNIQANQLALGKHQFGRIGQRMKVGPVTWPFHDLFWVHQGQVELEFPDLKCKELLDAPAGVLILPNTAFFGFAADGFASASVCHFKYSGRDAASFSSPGYLVVRRNEGLHVQNQVRLAMELSQSDAPETMDRRQRLLRSILDGFEYPEKQLRKASLGPKNRLTASWKQAADHLESMRTLSDVARLAGVSESGFRKLHRENYTKSAGDYLRDLRLKKGEELLATTGFSVSEIAHLVGYQHGETFCTAFRKSRGLTAGQYRRWSKPFA